MPYTREARIGRKKPEMRKNQNLMVPFGISHRVVALYQDRYPWESAHTRPQMVPDRQVKESAQWEAEP